MAVHKRADAGEDGGQAGGYADHRTDAGRALPACGGVPGQDDGAGSATNVSEHQGAFLIMTLMPAIDRTQSGARISAMGLTAVRGAAELLGQRTAARRGGPRRGGVAHTRAVDAGRAGPGDGARGRAGAPGAGRAGGQAAADRGWETAS